MEEAVANPVVQESILQWTARFMNDGGIFMWIIAVVWAMGIAIAVERLKAYFKFDIDGTSLMGNIKKNVISNQVQEAIQTCSESSSLLSFVMKNGLKRANQQKDQIQDALEASILEAVPKIERRLSYLALAANLLSLIHI